MNKKTTKTARIIALILAAAMVISAIVSAVLSMGHIGHDHAQAETIGTQYEITACLLPEEQAFRCEQTTVYTNETDGSLSQLFFFCYGNSLRRESTLPFEGDDLQAAFPQGYAPGGLQFTSVRVDGQEADWAVQGTDETFLRVDVELDEGETAIVEMEYDILLPVCSGFMGAGSFDWRLVNAFPTVCTWENGAFRTNGVLSAGRFAYAEPALWQLELSAPEGWDVIASGEETATETDGGWVRHTFVVENARDMVVAAGRRYTRFVSENDGRITVWANDGAAARAALDAAEAAIALYEGWLGPYAWPQIDIVMSQFAQEMRSVPGLVLLNKELFSLAEREELEHTIALGLAQQFFGEAVGVDPYGEPWLCESMSSLCALLYYGERYGDERLLQELRTRVEPALRVTIPGGAAADSSAAYFSSRAEYELLLRGRGTAALYELMLAMGKAEFLGALREYYTENCFAEGTGEAFAEACEAASGREWGAFLADMLANIGTDTNQTEWY